MATLRRYYIDLILLMVVAFVAGWGSWEAVRVYGDTLMLSAQSHLFGLRAAALFGAGLGWAQSDCDPDDFPELEAFLSREIAEIPPETYPEKGSREFRGDLYFYYHYYLNAYMGWMFRLFGVRVRAIHYACIGMHMASMIVLFLLFRLVMGRFTSFIGVLYVAVSPAYLLIVPDFRDYGKTPFLLLCFLLMGMLLRKPRRGGGVLFWSAALGACIGVGYGFREDLLVAMPVAIALLLVGADISAEKHKAWRVAGVAVLLASFLLVVSPFLNGQRQFGGFRMAHTLLAGTTEISENTVAFGYGDYDFGYQNLDTPVVASVAAYALRTDMTYPKPMFTRVYGMVGKDLFYHMAQRFPADFVARALATVEHTLRIPENRFIDLALETPPFTEYGFMHRVHSLQRPVHRFFSRFGFLCVLALPLMAAAWRLRPTLWVLGIVLYFGAYPSLLLEYRHLFHLAFLPVFLAGAVLSAAGCIAGRARQGWKVRQLRRTLSAPAARFCLGLLALVLLVGAGGAAMAGLRIYQGRQMEALLDQYNDLTLTPLAVAEERSGDRYVLRPSPGIAELRGAVPLREGHVAPTFLAARFKPARRTVAFSLLNSNPTMERPARIRLHGGGAYYFPVYDYGTEPEARFEGIAIDAEDRDLLEGLYLAEDADRLRLWPFIGVPKEREAFLPYKTGRINHALHFLWAELRYGFGRKPAEAARAYVRLIRRHPHHTQFADRALIHADRTGSGDLLAEVWSAIGAFMPVRRHLAAEWMAGRGQAYQEKGALSDALHFYREALKISPGDLWNLVRIGEIQALLGQYDKARDAYASVLSKAPESPYTAAKLDTLYKETAFSETAVAFWQYLVSQHPEAVVPRLYLGINLERRKDLHGALSAYRDALERRPDYAPALYRLGAVEAMRGDPVSGAEKMRRAARLEPTLADDIADRCARLAVRFVESEAHGAAVYLALTALDISPAFQTLPTEEEPPVE